MPKKKGNVIDLDNIKIDFASMNFDFDIKAGEEDTPSKTDENETFKQEYFDDFEFNARYVKPTKCYFKTTAIKYENAKKLAINLKPTPNFRYDAIVSGSFIFGDFIHAFMVNHHIQARRCIISTLGMNEANINALAALMRNNYILKLDLFVSIYFYTIKRKDIIPYLYSVLDADEFKGRFQLYVSHIHTKTFQIETSEDRKIIMQGSANLCSSANIEQFIIEENNDVYDFYANEVFGKLQRFKTIKESGDRKAVWREIEKKEFTDN